LPGFLFLTKTSGGCPVRVIRPFLFSRGLINVNYFFLSASPFLIKRVYFIGKKKYKIFLRRIYHEKTFWISLDLDSGGIAYGCRTNA
jgi:hypothetical protein